MANGRAPHRRPTGREVTRRPGRRALLPLAAALTMVATTAPTAGAQGDVSNPSIGTTLRPPTPGSDIRPTIQYEEALAHARDRIAFAPGDRVKVPFSPRRSDRWQVGGVAPQRLPAGRLSGKAIRDGVATPRRTAGPAKRHQYGRPPDSPPGRRPVRSRGRAHRRSVGPHRCPPRRRGRSGRAAPRGLRLPALLGADRPLDPARLGDPVDDRLLRRRGDCQRHPRTQEQRRFDDGRLERLDELEDDRRHRCRPRPRDPRRADRRRASPGPRPRSCARRPSSAARRPGRTWPARSRPPCATAVPTASISTSSRSSRATPTSSRSW